MEKINVLSLFDGVSCGRIALERAGIPVNQYFASEIDKHAIKVSQSNWPEIIQLGDVTKIDVEELPKIDLFLCGFPCQSHSTAGKQGGFNDPRGQLFFDALKILNYLQEKNPDIKFLFENVKMKKESADFVSKSLGVEHVLINSEKVSAQKRQRFYWTDIPNITNPEDKGIFLKNIIENGVVDKDKSYCIDASYYRNSNPYGYIKKCRGTLIFDITENLNKFRAMSREELLSKENIKDSCYRKLTQLELERLQTLPEGYTSSVNYNKACHAIGNGWTVAVIEHIFSGLKSFD